MSGFYVVPKVGLEPTRPCGQEILSLPCLPFHHSGRYRTAVLHLRPRAESNCRIRDLQSLVLPLDDAAIQSLYRLDCLFAKAGRSDGDRRLELEERVDMVAVSLSVVRNDLEARN